MALTTKLYTYGQCGRVDRTFWVQEGLDLRADPITSFLVQNIVVADSTPSLSLQGIERRVTTHKPNVVLILWIIHQCVKKFHAVHVLGGDALFATSCGRKCLLVMGYTSQIRVEYKIDIESR